MDPDPDPGGTKTSGSALLIQGNRTPKEGGEGGGTRSARGPKEEWGGEARASVEPGRATLRGRQVRRQGYVHVCFLAYRTDGRAPGRFSLCSMTNLIKNAYS
jgi:hypothetical protein